MTKKGKVGRERTYLTVTRTHFIEELQLFLLEIQKHNGKTISSRSELDSSKEFLIKWESKVSEFLKSSFSSPDSEYKEEFDRAGSLVGVMDALYQTPDRNALESKIKYHQDELNTKIRCVEALKDKAKYLIVDEDVSDQDFPVDFNFDAMETRISEKEHQYLIHLFDTTTTKDIHEFLTHSEIHVLRDFNSRLNTPGDMHIIVDPEIYKKYNGYLSSFKGSIGTKFKEFTHTNITGVQVFPDLQKFQILNNSIAPIETPWEEINALQRHLIEQLRTAKKTIDFQNVGNTARTLLQKVATQVFDPKKHTAPDNIDLSEGKYKNRLHTYIRAELTDEKKELKDYAIAVTTTAEKSIDLANTLTHDLKANLLMAESCVISVVTVIGLIKMIEK